MLRINLHPYQDSAVDQGLARGNLLIAYEQGLGKTPIAYAIIEELLGMDLVNTTVVVVPSSLKYQWAEQGAKLTDMPTREIKLKIDGEQQILVVPTEDHLIVVDGSPKQRAAQYMKIKIKRPDYVVLGYENVVNDWMYVRRIKPDAIVLDEATAIKTFSAQRTRKVKRFSAPYRYALTGTPIENGKPEELYSIMQWVDDEVLGRFDLFDKTYIVRNSFGGVKRYKNLGVLHARLAPAMARKTRQDEDVKPYLPEVQESVVDVVLDKPTIAAYRRIAGDLLKELKSVPVGAGSFDIFSHYHGGGQPDENTAKGKIMAKMGALDMLLDHPDLVVASGMAWETSERRRHAGEKRANWPGSKYCYQIWQDGVLDDVITSPKLDATLVDLQEILSHDERNKLVVFSRYPEMLGYIEEGLKGVSCVQYHGGMNPSQKAAAKAKYTTDPRCRVFLSSHAGAFGTDLYMANYLTNYDLAWSSGVQDQINKRHDRAASQFKNIFIRNMIVKGSVETRKYKALALKRKVGSAILDNRGADDKGRVVNDLTTLTDFLAASTL